MKRRMANRGFTLIELLVVMGLMALLTAMVFSNSFGMTQASAYSAAQETVYNVLQMARQRACIDGKDVYVILKTEDEKRPTLAIIEGYGRIAIEYKAGIRENAPDGDKSKGYFVDNGYSMQRPTESSVDIYNLTSGGQARLAGVDDKDEQDFIPEIDASRGQRTVADQFQFEHKVRQIWLAPVPKVGNSPAIPVTAGDWKAGELYGFSILPDQRLPKGFKIKLDKGDTICFYADGTSGVLDFSSGQGNTRNHDDVMIEVAEAVERKAGQSDKTIRYSVKNGNIKFEASAKKAR